METLKDLLGTFISYHTPVYGDYVKACTADQYEQGYNTKLHVLVLQFGKRGVKVVW